MPVQAGYRGLGQEHPAPGPTGLGLNSDQACAHLPLKAPSNGQRLPLEVNVDPPEAE